MSREIDPRDCQHGESDSMQDTIDQLRAELEEAREKCKTETWGGRVMTNVIKLCPVLDPDEVLSKSIGEFQSVVIIGYDHEGGLDARASLNINDAEILWLVENFKAKLVGGGYDGGE